MNLDHLRGHGVPDAFEGWLNTNGAGPRTFQGFLVDAAGLWFEISNQRDHATRVHLHAALHSADTSTRSSQGFGSFQELRPGA